MLSDRMRFVCVCVVFVCLCLGGVDQRIVGSYVWNLWRVDLYFGTLSHSTDGWHTHCPSDEPLFGVQKSMLWNTQPAAKCFWPDPLLHWMLSEQTRSPNKVCVCVRVLERCLKDVCHSRYTEPPTGTQVCSCPPPQTADRWTVLIAVMWLFLVSLMIQGQQCYSCSRCHTLLIQACQNLFDTQLDTLTHAHTQMEHVHRQNTAN